MARTLDLLGERWTLLIVRELLCGSATKATADPSTD
jgi:DNA-binding HxlR family transcriptional regulator